MKFALVLLASAATVLADTVHKHAKRVDHAAINNRNRRDEAQSLEKRQTYSGTATWYDVTTGTGACGQNMSPGDMLVALNTPQLDALGGYQNGVPSSCFQSITISYNGITQVATIKDECPTCAWGSLDMSEGLFTSFASLDQGVFQMSWWFNDGSNNGGQQTTTQWQAPTTSQAPAYSPPAYSPPSTTSTTSVYVPPPTTTSTQPAPAPTPTTTSQSNSPADQNTGQDTSSTTQAYGNLPMMNSAVVQLAQLINAAVPH